MRVLHFIDSGGLYGAEKVLLNLSREMKKSGQFQPMVGCIVTSNDQPCALFDEAQKQGLDAVRLVVRNGWLALDLPRVARLLRDLKIDLIHSHGYKASVWGFLIKPWSGIPIMATCHLWFKTTGQPLKMKAMLVAEKWVYRNYRDVVGVSAPIRDVLLSSGIASDRIQIIENGVEVRALPKISPAEADGIRQSMRLPPDAFLVLNAARLNRQKGQWNLVKAASLLKKRGEAVHFLIVGDGPLESELKALAKIEGVEDMVTFGGFREDVDNILQLSDAFVLPSLDEGMPMSLLEAIARKVPVVTTPVGDIPQIIIGGRSGHVVPVEDPLALADALAALLHDPAHGAALAERALAEVECRYSSGAMFAKYATVYGNYRSGSPVPEGAL